jgi:hypothetical protein
VLQLLPILVQCALAAGSGVGGAVGGSISGAVSGWQVQRWGRSAKRRAKRSGGGQGRERVWGAGMGTAVAEERKEEGETQWGRARGGGRGDPGGTDIYCSRSDAR